MPQAVTFATIRAWKLFLRCFLNTEMPTEVVKAGTEIPGG